MLDKRLLTLQDMLDIQDRLNEITVSNWKDSLTVDHYRVAMFAEFSELMDSVSWKWWKKCDNHDVWNLKVEAIDILHFALSVLILNGYQNHYECSGDLNWGYMPNEIVRVKISSDDGQLNHKEFIASALSMLGSSTEVAYDAFFRSVGMTAEEISAIYIAKSTLNEIRQHQGYKSGDYTRVKGGKDDNEWLEGIVNDYIASPNATCSDMRKSIFTMFECSLEDYT